MPGFSLRVKSITPFTRLCLIFFCSALLLYAIGIGNFAEIYFDELTHVPAARKLIDEGINPITWHPPLNNLFTVLSMMLFGDNPLGWRALSVLAGALLVLGLLHICFRGGLGLERTAYVGCLALSSHFIYVHARIAKPDIFFCALLVWALALLLRAYTTAAPRHKKILLASSACLWGLATSVKWLALVGFVLCIGHFLLLQVRPAARSTHTLHWHSSTLLAPLTAWQVLSIYTVAYLGGYLSPYLLTADLSFMADFKTIWQQQHSISTEHAYQSTAWQWPLMLRPIWYGYHPVGEALTRAVFCLGNPFLMVGGLLSLLYSVWRWYRTGSLLACMCVIFYAGFYGFWLATARGAAFHYYYFPALLFLLLSLGENGSSLLVRQRGAAWAILALAVLLFIYYLPVLTGVALPITPYLRYWSWFDSWV